MYFRYINPKDRSAWSIEISKIGLLKVQNPKDMHMKGRKQPNDWSTKCTEILKLQNLEW